jgi:uncharacterized protein (DUF2126 family)/transglutaminase-like putative cysteine protease
MAIHVALTHCTTYRYDRAVSLGPHIVRLRPAPHCRTPILSYSLRVEPKEHFINWQQDPFSNYLARLMFRERSEHLETKVELVAEMAVYNPFDFFLEPAAEYYPFKYEPQLARDLVPYLKQHARGPSFRKFLDGIDRSKQGTVDFLVSLNIRLHKEIAYRVRMKPGVQSPDKTLSTASGSCRDSAWLLCQLMRSCGIAARFVSGYLIQLRPDIQSVEEPSGPENDFSDLHAWAEAYLPGAGWIGFDPTSGLLAGEGHIPLACTPEPSSAAPIAGTTEKGEVQFDFAMSLQRIYESPRVSKPHSEKEWESILLLGDRLDEKIHASDLRVTIAGQPTFVSIDDMESAEWNTETLGPSKRILASNFIRRLRARFAPGGLLHFAQSEEHSVGWAFQCFWRQDGVPIWKNVDLVANEETDYHVSSADSLLFSQTLARRLGIEKCSVIPAYKNSSAHLSEERRLSANVDASHEEPQDESESARAARVLAAGEEEIVGHVLPIQREHKASGMAWVSPAWVPRSGRLDLVPGETPMGFRLPPDLRALSRDPADYASDVRGQNSMLQEQQDPISDPSAHDPDWQREESAQGILRTTIAVQPRAGKLNVFLPELPELGSYLDLVGAVEETAQHLGIPVLVEGHPPPSDPRLNVIKVAPAPGVIRLQTHPGNSWREMVEITTGVYEEARQTRLGTEKFMLDGRHSGTGGGDHLLVGAPVTADSPFLRKPDLLRSLINYWQNHPSLSYLFAGAFIGPASQSPRVDETCRDALYELEIVFSQIPKEEAVPPALVDQLFRDILVDGSGDRQHAEFCIDKLYSPDERTGRLGLLELRAFEMPPHERMSLLQQLLLRALVADFWEKPYRRPLMMWGTELHDRFLLPHFVWQDFSDVIAELNRRGHTFELRWFAPQFEFRFPLIGEINYRETRIELRRALEPWRVLRGTGSVGEMVRYVDSSLERLQVKASGLAASRYGILCNRIPVPLHPSGTNGEYLGGVRYRAWLPPICLHPTIAVHTPLTFDLYDAWNHRAVAGCTYHVYNPGGQNPATFPINAYEAESRRLSRFSAQGHTSGSFEPLSLPKTKQFPFTLDLRTSSET